MRIEDIHSIDSNSKFHQKALQWAMQFDEICFFNSNESADEWSSFDCCLAVKAVSQFVADGTDTFLKAQHFIDQYPGTFIPGFLSYDLKNEIEDLTTDKPDILQFPLAYFFVPAVVITIKNGNVSIEAEDPEHILKEILSQQYFSKTFQFSDTIKARWTKAEYLHAFDRIQSHIQQGDLYEANLCQEFYAEHAVIDPLSVYQQLSEVSPTPFSTFFRRGDHYILSASPERFMAKRENLLISQPIKGTAPRGATSTEDQRIIRQLQDSQKEIAENVMIVDLVRNDLTRSAVKGSVKADRLFEIQSFKQVHQMVSTITCQKSADVTDIEAIKNTFPAGSMTGAPKIAAMKHCEEIENTRRGLYSGAIGYFSPNGDFDFNVVIRTLLYNASSHYISFHTGGAITNQAEGEQEYEECLLKAKSLLDALQTSIG
ncbi:MULTISPECIES: aminodeoxychorismate synthase component I [unclassified Sphingobacterium]|uniref:aminodeoxychorismate synthase component I n=1 Tax=unclassified Sphingobacterium TaxID=2609468 RepID=UPI0025F3F214|nr:MULTISPECIES: aminodeoxychorismate synthase component I [unclassified Sphingobacterium]